ncbi:hypothetical protein EVAR_48472_1 [Eumeta japonica]|uniref:Uncharacterized protein n=1 Tax=Eumeta variegata TaxID=151549 RepID=A0A4C1XJ20_EUMVA|nr:hypothetical protein EVAR_48472_1 [Eumeta japonica]
MNRCRAPARGAAGLRVMLMLPFERTQFEEIKLPSRGFWPFTSDRPLKLAELYGLTTITFHETSIAHADCSALQEGTAQL